QWLVDLDGVADLLQPGGDGAFGDGFAELRHLNDSSGTASGLRCFLLWLFRFFLRSLFLSLLCGIVSAFRLFARLSVLCDTLANIARVVFFKENLGENTRDRRWNSRVPLAAGYRSQRLVDLDGVADLL